MTGYHVIDAINLITCTMTTEEMYNNIHDEMENGCQTDKTVKPAFIADGGNILLGTHLHVKEKKKYI